MEMKSIKFKMINADLEGLAKLEDLEDL